MKNFHVCDIFFKYIVNANTIALVMKKVVRKTLIIFKLGLPDRIGPTQLNGPKSRTGGLIIFKKLRSMPKGKLKLRLMLPSATEKNGD